jgi:TPR repeat protein
MVSLVCLLIASSVSLPPEPGALFRVKELWAECSKGNESSCYRLSTLRTVRIVDGKQRVAATSPLEKDCSSGEPSACYVLAMHFDDDGGLPVDGKRAFELYSAACEAGFPPACHRTSVFYRVSVPSQEPDAPRKASALLAGACEAGLPAACFDLAQAGAVGGAEPVDDAIAARLLEKGCAGGSFDACLLIAKRLLPPLKTPPTDPKESAKARTEARKILEPSVGRLRSLCRRQFAAPSIDLHVPHWQS